MSRQLPMTFSEWGCWLAVVVLGIPATYYCSAFVLKIIRHIWLMW